MTKEEIISLFNKYYEYVYTSDSADERGDWKHIFADKIIELHNKAISEYEAGRKVIKAKVLRNKKDGLYYARNWTGWVKTEHPSHTMPMTGNTAEIALMTSNLRDAEAVDIEITIKEGGEG